MTAKPPAAPPAANSPKGTGESKTAPTDTAPRGVGAKANPDQVGQAANTKVNTTNQGLQQDR